MSVYLQETDSRLIFPVPDELKYSFSILQENQTTGSSIYHNFFPVTIEANIIDGAFNTLKQFQNQEIVKEAKKLLFTIQKIVKKFQQYRFDLDYLPPLHTFPVDDGSLLIEWIFEDFRIGFSLEQESNESSWYLVTNPKFGEISASGYLSDVDNEKIVIWLLNFILVNS